MENPYLPHVHKFVAIITQIKGIYDLVKAKHTSAFGDLHF